MKFGAIDLDPDSEKLLEISAHFLIQLFGHDPVKAGNLVLSYVSASDFDEDHIHADWPYTTAAKIHYRFATEFPLDQMNAWLIDGEFHNTPPDALQHIREHYFSS